MVTTGMAFFNLYQELFQIAAVWRVQHHTGLTHISNFWHLGALALSLERQSAQMSNIKNSGLDQYGKV